MIIVLVVEVTLYLIVDENAFYIVLSCDLFLVLSSSCLMLKETSIILLFFEFLHPFPEWKREGVEWWMRKLMRVIERFVKVHILYYRSGVVNKTNKS